MKKDTFQADDSNSANVLDNPLNPLDTFENFVVGEPNKFAFLAAKSIVENSLCNLLFIQGEIGTGKTHLLHAIGNTIQAQGKKVICVSIENFLSEFTENIANRTMDRFRKRYHECDLLLVEDFKYIQHKNQTQQEFFHLFETLLSGNKQIVIISSVKLKKLHEMDEGLKSQIQSGLEVNIQQPDIETRIGIVKKMFDMSQLQLEDEIINYLATKIEYNIHQIQGIVTKINAYVKLMKKDVTIEYLSSILEDL